MDSCRVSGGGSGKACTGSERSELGAVVLCSKDDSIFLEVEGEVSAKLARGNEAASRTARPSRYFCVGPARCDR